jgi:hypothetical protein
MKVNAVAMRSNGRDLATERPVVRIRWNVATTAVRAALWRRLAGDAGIVVVDPVLTPRTSPIDQLGLAST